MIRVVMYVLALGIAGPASAATVTFVGSSENANAPPAADASCPAATPNRLNIQNGPGFATGTSNLGAFTFTQTHCTTGGPGPYSGGVFEYFFAQGDMLQGSYTGAITPTATPGVLDNMIALIVTGGTGRFAGATGAINGDGTITFVPGRSPLAKLELDGTLDLPAIPEPATWLSMIVGFGAIGGALRARGRTVALA